MNRSEAQTAVVLSMFWVAAVFGYRKLTEPVTGTSPAPSSTAHFMIGFGFTAIILSLMAQAAPALGGMMAVLVATGDTLANGKPLFADVTKALKATSTATGRSPASTSRFSGPWPTPLPFPLSPPEDWRRWMTSSACGPGPGP